MTYRPAFQKQGDGTTCAWENCNPTSHAMAVDRDWLGARKGVPKVIRDDIHTVGCPGTSMIQNRAAVAMRYGTTMDARYDVAWETFLDGLVSGRGAVVTIMYSTVHGTPYDGCRTFDGRHAIYVNERRWNAALDRYEALVFDPLADHRRSWIPQGPQWWPLSLLERGMLASYATDGRNNVEVSFTRNTDSTVKKSLYEHDPKSGAIPHYRPKAAVAGEPVGIIAHGDLVSVAETVQGGVWTINGHQGTTWYRLGAVNGQAVLQRFGVAAVFAAQGWFTGVGGAV